jgi:hypothetical protein
MEAHDSQLYHAECLLLTSHLLRLLHTYTMPRCPIHTGRKRGCEHMAVVDVSEQVAALWTSVAGAAGGRVMERVCVQSEAIMVSVAHVRERFSGGFI